MAASKVRPNLSWETPKTFSARIRWPVEETGRNSVRPWRTPRNMAF